MLQGNDSLALSLSQSANQYLTKNDSDKYVLAKTYLGTILFDMGQLYTASKVLVEAVEYSSSIDYENPYAYQVLGEVSMKLGNYKEAVDYLRKGLFLAQKSKLSLEEILIIFVWAQTELEHGSYARTDSLISSALELPISKKEVWCKTQSYTLLAQSALDQGKFQKSIVFSDSAIRVARSIGFESNVFKNLLIQSAAYLKLNNIDSAGLKIIESKHFITESTRIPLRIKYLNNYSEYLFAKDSLSSAYKTLKEVLTLTDSLNSTKEAQLTSDLQTKYNTELKDQELQARTNELLLKEEKLKVEKRVRWIWIISSVIIVAVGYFAYRKYQEKQKLKLKYELLELNQKALQLQMNPHFIFNVMNTLYQWLSEEKLDEAKSQLLNVSKLIRNTLNSTRESTISLQEELESIESFIELNLVLSDHKFDYKIDDGNLDASEIALAPMLIQPIIENAIQHGLKSNKPGTSSLSITFRMVENYLECKVIDEGERDLNSSTPVKEGLGISTSIIKERLEYLSKGEYEAFSTKVLPNGTEVILRIRSEEYWG
jgi:tetratricopeptide (TPR) repeat protein